MFNRWISNISPFIKKFNDLIKFTNNLKNFSKIPYTLRAYAKGLEHILAPIIKKMETIEKRIKTLGKFIIFYLYMNKR